MGSKLLTIDEAAAFLRLKRKTLYDYRYRGVGPRSLRVGGRVAYLEEDLEAWVGAQPVKPGDQSAPASLEG